MSSTSTEPDLHCTPTAAPASVLADQDVFTALRKTWQPVATTRELHHKKIVSYTLLGEEIVVALLGGERMLAARDLCPHRGAKFGLGTIVNGNLQCPYHGWEFDAAGACARIPSLIDPQASLEKACLQTFAVQDRYGMIWVRLDPAGGVDLPEIPEFEDPGWTYLVAEPMPFGCGFRREIDNYLDMSHFAFAHRDTLGVAAASHITDIEITHFDDGFLMSAPFPVLSNPDRTPGKLQQSHHRRQRTFLPNFTTMRQSFHDGDERVLVHIPSPHSVTSCTVFWALAISPGFAGPPAAEQLAFAVRVLEEDRVMVENQRPLEVPIGTEQSVMVPADRLANTYKAALREFTLSSQAGLVPISGVDPAPAQDRQTVTILFGSQTGTAERLGSLAARTLRRAGFEATHASMQHVAPELLTGTVLLLTSSYGNGEPPDTARPFFEALWNAPGTDLSEVRYCVFALGDSTYPSFCGAGRSLDTQFEQLGARRLLARVECDREVDVPFAAWIRDVQHTIRTGKRVEVVSLLDDDLPAGYVASRPVRVSITENRLLSRMGSEKETRHYEIATAGTGLAYEPGDALGVIPVNDPALVEDVLACLHAPAERPLEDGITVREALLNRIELRRPSFALLHEIARRTGDAALLEIVNATHDRSPLVSYAAGHDVLDVLRLLPSLDDADTEPLLRLCDRLRSRLYSIASSPCVSPESIHITVETVRYRERDRTYAGAASTFLADRVAQHTRVPVYLHRNPNFRLPADPSSALIMVGPGTGIAPFRAFLQHRASTGATGRNWLFFGDRHSRTDFLYEDELKAWEHTGLLTHLSTAFSRDGPEKLYVQHRMAEHAAELMVWIDQGAAVYVCGDSERMAHDVDGALREIVAQQLPCSADQATEYLRRLQTEGRYKRDVY